MAAACVLSLPATAAAKVRQAPTRMECVNGCAAGRLARPGALLRLHGKLLNQTGQVVFLGADGVDDDVVAPPATVRAASVDVRVPLGAPQGPVALVDRDGAQSAPTPPLSLAPGGTGGPPVELAVRAPRAYLGASPPAGVTYVLHGSAPQDVGIDLVRVLDGFVVAHMDAYGVPPEVPERVDWNGTVAGRAQPPGRYAFRVTPGQTLAGVPGEWTATAAPAAIAPGAATAPAAAAPPRAAGAPGGLEAPFDFARDRFPILGAHTFGTGTAAFGGARGHQGQDTFAACGTPLVAAHAGVVEYAGYHPRAGYYVVVDNAAATTDYVYMHLREAALVETGDRVLTGQPLGAVGDSGDADGCHLHFEIWTAPGWYSGGRPIDPLPYLKAWDR